MKNKRPTDYACEQCGKIKYAKYPALKKRFCSHTCSNQWKWDNIRNSERKIDYFCKVCGNACKKPKTRIFIEGVFCSKKCFYQHRKDNPPTWLISFPKGCKPWNYKKTMGIEYRLLCKFRAKKQWEDLEYREKQMKRDFTKFKKAGPKALQVFWSNPDNDWRRKRAGKTLHNKFLAKVGVNINE